MYDWKGRIIEEDDYTLKEKNRCLKGHFLSKNPKYIKILGNDGPYYQQYMSEEKYDQEHFLDYVWICKCGAESK